MDQELINQYLNILYYTAKDNLSAGSDTMHAGRILSLSTTQVVNILHYLSGKGWIDTTKSYGDKVVLTADGIDQAMSWRKGKIFKRFRFLKCDFFPPSNKMVYSFRFWYEVVDENETQQKSILVQVSDVLSMMWGLHFFQSYDDAEKKMLQIARHQVAEKLKEGTLQEHEEMLLLSNNQPGGFPYPPESLIDTKYADYQVETGRVVLAIEINANKTAAAIIELRDNINAIFSHKHKTPLLLLNQERNLLDFFKPADTAEELSARLASLAQVSRNLDVNILRKLTNTTDTTVGSVSLLNSLLESVDKPNQDCIEILRHIGRLRQGYPAHVDVADVIKAHKYFKLSYPVKNYQEAWLILCERYHFAICGLFEIFTEKYLQS